MRASRQHERTMARTLKTLPHATHLFITLMSYCFPRNLVYRDGSSTWFFEVIGLNPRDRCILIVFLHVVSITFCHSVLSHAVKLWLIYTVIERAQFIGFACCCCKFTPESVADLKTGKFQLQLYPYYRFRPTSCFSPIKHVSYMVFSTDANYSKVWFSFRDFASNSRLTHILDQLTLTTVYRKASHIAGCKQWNLHTVIDMITFNLTQRRLPFLYQAFQFSLPTLFLLSKTFRVRYAKTKVYTDTVESPSLRNWR